MAGKSVKHRVEKLINYTINPDIELPRIQITMKTTWKLAYSAQERHI